jgi:isovaleryl-CoA dehydrogenase
MATWMAGEAIRTPGGNGCINDYRVGRLWREAKPDEIGAGTGAIHRMLIGRGLFSETTWENRIPYRGDDHDRYPARP